MTEQPEPAVSALRGPVLALRDEGGADDGELFELFARIVADRDGFPHAAPLTKEAFEATWVDQVSATVICRLRGPLVGAYYLKPNYAGRAAHIANAGYMVGRAWRRNGIGRMLVQDSIRRAPGLGFDAIEFNLVFESNPARGLYEELGWQLTGRVPGAVGGEDAYTYWRKVP